MMRALGATAIIVLSCAIGVHGTTCPEDSVVTEDGGCKCVSPCPPNKCRQGQRPVQVRIAMPENPGSCCPIYDCIPLEPISWVPTDDGQMPKGCMDSNGIPRYVGEKWQDGPCVHCTCEDPIGRPSCHATMCRSCERPAPRVPGECCSHCLESENDTTTTLNPVTTMTTINVPVPGCDSLMDCEPPCHLGAISDLDGCPICACPNHIPNTTSPDLTDKICPELPHCGLDCVLGKDQGGCAVCACEDSIDMKHPVKAVNAVYEEGDDSAIICPELKCDLHCEQGLLMDENDCTLCQCKPQAFCPSPIGCRKKCPFGYKLNKRGCLTCRCRAICLDHRNETHPEGSSWQPDVCTSCTCDSAGRLVCKETVCSVACKEPLPPLAGTCCPICPIDTVITKNEHSSARGWGIIPITLIAVLTLLCILLMIYIVRGRFRGRLSPSSNIYAPYPAQYYKCVPAYDAPLHHNEKIVPL